MKCSACGSILREGPAVVISVITATGDTYTASRCMPCLDGEVTRSARRLLLDHVVSAGWSQPQLPLDLNTLPGYR